MDKPPQSFPARADGPCIGAQKEIRGDDCQRGAGEREDPRLVRHPQCQVGLVCFFCGLELPLDLANHSTSNVGVDFLT